MFRTKRAHAAEQGRFTGSGRRTLQSRSVVGRMTALLSASLMTASLFLGISAAHPAAVAADTAIPNLDVPFFSQIDPEWATMPLFAGCTDSIGSHGCALTSLAMVYAYYGIDLLVADGAGMSPAVLDTWMSDHALYWSDCDVRWDELPTDKNGRGVVSKKPVALPASWRQLVDGELASGRPVIARVQYTDSGTYPHFVVITGKTDVGDYLINDPALKKPAQRRLFADDVPDHPGVKYEVMQIQTLVPTASTPLTRMIDEGSSPNFKKSGAGSWLTLPQQAYSPEVTVQPGYAGSMYYRNSGDAINSRVYGTWSGHLTPGIWTVSVWIPRAASGLTKTKMASYSVQYAPTLNQTIVISQDKYSDQWVQLGTFDFAQKAEWATTYGSSDYSSVMLGDYTLDSGKAVIFDAVKFEYVGPSKG